MGGYLIFDMGKYHLWLWRFCNVAFLPTKDSLKRKKERVQKRKKKKLHKNPNSISGKWQPDDGYLEFL